jgi:hypothetical protein
MECASQLNECLMAFDNVPSIFILSTSPWTSESNTVFSTVSGRYSPRTSMSFSFLGVLPSWNCQPTQTHKMLCCEKCEGKSSERSHLWGEFHRGGHLSPIPVSPRIITRVAWQSSNKRFALVVEISCHKSLEKRHENVVCQSQLWDCPCQIHFFLRRNGLMTP